jgi:pimeloyl-ACP methyl ester carboxylesterase
MHERHPLPGNDVVVAGTRLHVVSHGSGAGPAMLLLHGYPTSSYLWRSVQRDLGHGHATHAVDLLGFGASERPPAGRYDLASQAQLMLALLDELSLDRVVLVAHDVGGGVAVHLAALAPERVAALVLTGTPLHADAWPADVLTSISSVIRSPRLMLSRRLGGRLLRPRLATGTDDVTAGDIEHYLRPLRSSEGAAALGRFMRAVDPAAVEAAFGLVRADPPPTLVVWGNDDALLSAAYGRRIAAEVPGSTYVPIWEAGHLLPQQRPERLAEEVGAWLADLVPTP